MIHLITIILFYSINSEPITGILEKKHPTKSQQTICAGGSEYYVLKKGNTEIILQGDTSGFSVNIGKTIRLSGFYENKTIKPSVNPYEQSLTTDVMCTYFVVEKILQKNMLSGIIVKKSWSKSVQSYCAGGSDYYVLTTKDKEVVLAGDEKLILSNVGKEVKITGYWQTKTIKNENPYEQRPVDPFNQDADFQCEVFMVESIK